MKQLQIVCSSEKKIINASEMFAMCLTFFFAKCKSQKMIILKEKRVLESHFTKGRNLGFGHDLSSNAVQILTTFEFYDIFSYSSKILQMTIKHF